MLRIAGIAAVAVGIVSALVSAIVQLEHGPAEVPAAAALAQECVSEALPVQAPAPTEIDAAEAVRLPSTGNAGLLGRRNAPMPMQECPTPVAEPAPTETVAAATPVATAPAPPSPTATAGPEITLPGGGGGGDDGGLQLPPGTIGY